ncbi:hypothetical protein DDE82_004234 [Stemphylium lycopersici]|nr:hypothetical protein DDE82_004234 [Stemphylium lycopersici]
MHKTTTQTEGITIRALCAVVDKLPAPRPWANSTSAYKDELSRRSIVPPVAGTGFEGIAYSSHASDASVLSSEGLSPSETGAIDFIIAEHSVKNARHRDILRLPLANTVFQTGMPTTMFLSDWKTISLAGDLKMISKTNISQHGIRLLGRNSSWKTESALSIPLLPLTVPRLVEGCMGNIIRRIVDSDGKSVQASSELENVVPRFFASRGQPAQSTVAWALVIPGALKDIISARTEELLSIRHEDAVSTKPEHLWECLWSSDPPIWNKIVSQALSEGARLHRVLSGGGGWGKKAGLLSLDPVPNNGPAESSSGSDPEDFESTLTPVVRDGDAIQFFISPKSDLTQEATESDNYETVANIPQLQKSWGWELGTVPSTMDSIPGESWQHKPTDKDRTAVLAGSFGALTEGAMTLSRFRQTAQGGSIDTSTIDVPFSRFWAINIASRHGETVKPKPTNSKPYAKYQKKLKEYRGTYTLKFGQKDVKGDGKEKDPIDTPSTPLQQEHFKYDSGVSAVHRPVSTAQSPSRASALGNSKPTLLRMDPFQKLPGGLSIHQLVPTRKFSSTRSMQDSDAESAPLHPGSLTANAEGSQSELQSSKLKISHSRVRDLSASGNNDPRPPPSSTIPELAQALRITGVRVFGRLSVRTAKAILRELRKGFDKQNAQYQAVMSARHGQASRTERGPKISRIKTGVAKPSRDAGLIRRVSTEEKAEPVRSQEKIGGTNSASKKKGTARKVAKAKNASKKGSKEQPPIRKMAVKTANTPEALSKTFRILYFQFTCLVEEAGAAIVSIRLRRLGANLQQQQPRRRLSMRKRGSLRDSFTKLRADIRRRARQLLSTRGPVIVKYPVRERTPDPPRRRTRYQERRRRSRIRKRRRRLRLMRGHSAPKARIVKTKPRVRRRARLVPKVRRVKITPNVSRLRSWPKPLELRRQGLERYLSSSPRGRGRFVYRFHPVSWIWNERSVRVAQKKRLEKRRRLREEKESEFTKTVESWLGGG